MLNRHHVSVYGCFLNPRIKQAAWLCLLAGLLLAGCTAKVVVNRVDSLQPGSRARLDGIVYALPRTVVRAAVPFKRKDSTPGEFPVFAPLYFPNEDLIPIEKTTFSIGRAEFTTRGEPDPHEIFVVKVKGGYFENKMLELDLTANGLMTKGVAESKDESLDFALKSAKTIASIASPFLLSDLGSASGASDITPFRSILGVTHRLGETRRSALEDRLSKTESDCYNKLSEENKDYYLSLSERDRTAFCRAYLAGNGEAFKRNKAIQALTADEWRCFDCLPLVEQDFYLQLTAKEKSYFCNYLARPKTLELFASTTADLRTRFRENHAEARTRYDEILAYQAHRERLVTGQKEKLPPAETMRVMLEEIDKLIENHKQVYFLGTSANEEWTGNFEYTQKGARTQLPLFKFSRKCGCEMVTSTTPLCPDQTSAVSHGIGFPPAFAWIENCDDAEGERFIALKLESATDNRRSFERASAPEYTETVEQRRRDRIEEEGDRGFFYRIPAVAMVKLTGRRVCALPDREFGRANLQIAQLGWTVSLPPSTGGRTTKYTLALYDDTGALKNFALGSNALLEKAMLDELSETAKTLTDATDEMARVKRRRELLEELQKLREAQEALKRPVPAPEP